MLNRLGKLVLLPLITIFLTSGNVMAAERDYAATAVKAARFFHYQEWASAGALYSLMLADKPEEVTTYGHAIVAAGMLADTAKQADLTAFAIASHVPVDSLFSAVEKTSFSVGQTSLYEHYLLDTKAHTPWLTRIVDAHLMRYYTYRRDPHGMIEYSRIMLRGNPDSRQFLYTLAQGYLFNGQTAEALDVYRHIVALDPQSMEALLYLANYSMQSAQSDPLARDEALSYFSQAESIRSTPYITAAIARLKAMKDK